MKRDYFTRLTYAARWRMTPYEAEELLTDYRELLEAEPRDEEGLLRDFGRPEAAVRLAAHRGEYFRWLAAFAAMALCLLLPALCQLLGVWQLFSLHGLKGEIILLLLGTALSLTCFPKGEGRKGLPKALPILMGALLALCLWANWWVWRALPTLLIAPERTGAAARLVYEAFGACAGLAGLFGLTAARVSDRRWRGLYVLALTAAALCCAVVMLLSGMEVSLFGPDSQVAWTGFFHRVLLITAIGLAGTGAALC